MIGARALARQVTRTVGFVGITASMLPGYLAARQLRPEAHREDVRKSWVGAWSRLLLHMFALDVDVEGTAPAGTGRGRLIVANHRSAADIVILLNLFRAKMVSRADISTWPLIGAAASSVGTVFVDRDKTQSRTATLRSLLTLLRAGETICMFPEGTTFSGDEVQPFHRGAFVIAQRAQAEFLPVGIAYEAGGAEYVGEAFTTHLARMARAAPSRAAVTIGAVRAPEGGLSRQLAETLREDVQALVLRSRARLSAS